MFSQRVAFKAMHQPFKADIVYSGTSVCVLLTSFCLGAKVFYKSSVSLSKASDRIESIFFPVDTPRSTDIHFLAECHTKSARELDNEKTFRATCLVNRPSRISNESRLIFCSGHT